MLFSNAHARLLQRCETLSVAESCTGGLLAGCITEISGVSKVFDRGVVTYSNAAKTALLGVPADVIEAHGAVSEAVAIAMAQGMQLTAATHHALSITGIAGPDGGTAEKPVGLVYIGYASSTHNCTVKRFLLNGDRKAIRQQSVAAAIQLLEEQLL